MKQLFLLLAAVALGVLLCGCSDERTVQPELITEGPTTTGMVGSGLVPDGYYSLAFDFAIGAYSDFELISTKNGVADPVWPLTGLTDWNVPTLFGPSPLGHAFDLDGSIYTIIGAFNFDEADCQSRFAEIDAATGQVTYIGDPVPLNFCGPDIDSRGTFYVCGMDVPHLGYIHGTGRLYTVDKVTGAFTEIGPLNVALTEWMDLAFDSNDELWATTQNKLFKINSATGEVTEVIPILGVPGDPPPPPYSTRQEVMSIAFDSRDNLYGTAMNVEWDTGRGSPVMKINTQTGQATVIGYTEQIYNHGGDIMPKMVRVAHLRGDGSFSCININMRDLAAHLAHGDYVPGTAGYAWDCP